jgi:hypothetical protein
MYIIIIATGKTLRGRKPIALLLISLVVVSKPSNDNLLHPVAFHSDPPPTRHRVFHAGTCNPRDLYSPFDPRFDRVEGQLVVPALVSLRFRSPISHIPLCRKYREASSFHATGVKCL